jgi:hypothetical protein
VEWPEPVVVAFVTTFLQRTLHDASFERAVARASVGRFELPTVFQPSGLRNGLDLGRILEEHRRRMDSLSAGMKTFGRELEAAQRSLGGEGWVERLGRVTQRIQTLEGARLACEEINRDRDPAGWSRLAANRELLDVLEDDDRVDREQLARQLRTS